MKLFFLCIILFNNQCKALYISTRREEILLIDLKISGFQTISESEKKVILSVDDDPGYSRYLRDALKQTYHVALAFSGAQAIAWLATNHCDLILLDYGMPIANGKTIFEMLKGEENTKDIPIDFPEQNTKPKSKHLMTTTDVILDYVDEDE